MTITIEQLAKVFPKTKKEVLAPYVAPLNQVLDKYGFDTPMAVRVFLAQIGHESGGFNFVRENLNYSEAGLVKIFGKYFNATTAKAYARNPEKIANKVYASRMGNGPESSGEGWKFRGRGLIQITGKNNYTALAKFLKMSIDDTIKYLETPQGAVESAAWFFSANGLIDDAKLGAVTVTTKKINGGTHGLADRIDIFNRSKTIIV